MPQPNPHDLIASAAYHRTLQALREMSHGEASDRAQRIVIAPVTGATSRGASEAARDWLAARHAGTAPQPPRPTRYGPKADTLAAAAAQQQEMETMGFNDARRVLGILRPQEREAVAAALVRLRTFSGAYARGVWRGVQSMREAS